MSGPSCRFRSVHPAQQAPGLCVKRQLATKGSATHTSYGASEEPHAFNTFWYLFSPEDAACIQAERDESAWDRGGESGKVRRCFNLLMSVEAIHAFSH